MNTLAVFYLSQTDSYQLVLGRHYWYSVCFSDICCVFFLQASARDKLATGSSSPYKESDNGFVIIGKYVK